MTMQAPSDPARAVDLSGCEREPIHLLGRIQPFGCLLAVSPGGFVQHASANLADYLGREAGAALGSELAELIDPEPLRTIRRRLELAAGSESPERIFGLILQAGRAPFDLAAHATGDTVVLEAEPSARDDQLDAGSAVRAMIGRLRRADALPVFCQDAARQMQALTGFDRVMVYRFDHDGAGEVLAEAAAPGLEPLLGLRYPASDIPAQARALYVRNWLRIIADVDAPTVPIVAGEGRPPLDLSMSILRAVSPVHVEYLRNMGVAASMSVSILREGRLWGLFACHHLTPRYITFERRTAAELFGQMFSLLLESRERERESEQEMQARAVHNRLVAALAADGVGFAHIAAFLDEIKGIVACDGVALAVDGEVTLHGQTPTRTEVADLVADLGARGVDQVHAVHEIGRNHPPGRAFAERAAGLLAVPISSPPRDYLLFFRREAARTVTWAGDPSKPASAGAGRIDPRTSFAAWREEVRGQSLPWTPLERRIVEGLRAILLEVVLRLTDLTERERRAARERQELLIAELNHRVRNILGLIRGLVAQSKASAGTLEDFAAMIGGRIQALARAHDQITTDHWGPAPLRSLIMAEAEAYLADKAERVRIAGPNVLLEPEAFSTMALVVHELMTNSAKYGALCDSMGSVEVAWDLDRDGRLAIDWREQGGPPVQPPTRRGFGTTIIERSIPFDLKGEVRVDYAVTGLQAQLVIPAPFVSRTDAEAPLPQVPARSATSAGRLLSGRVLLVEDSMIIALDAADMLRDLGADEVDLAAGVGEALRLLEASAPSFVLLDVNLGGETSFPVAERLHERGIPFMFATGYGDDVAFPAKFKGVPVIAKPYSLDSLVAGLAERGSGAGAAPA
jgi:light-regulated signal transduction histidine kinase (bacteriophytochrome)/CheY-like chemotaxis protein